MRVRLSVVDAVAGRFEFFLHFRQFTKLAADTSHRKQRLLNSVGWQDCSWLQVVRRCVERSNPVGRQTTHNASEPGGESSLQSWCVHQRNVSSHRSQVSTWGMCLGFTQPDGSEGDRCVSELRSLFFIRITFVGTANDANYAVDGLASEMSSRSGTR
jgi:hypothetical protein